MEKLSMCRICLATDLRMDSIINTHLQDIYERLTSKKFETDDSRPITACYICCARLQNCHQLSVSCLQSEEMFKQMLSGNTWNTLCLQDATTSTMRLGTTPVIVESLGDELIFDLDGMKVEPHNELEGVEVEVKVVVDEVLANEVPVEYIKEEPHLEEDFSVAESEEIPLDIVKHEPGNIDPSVSVTKKLRPAVLRRHPQDTKKKLNVTPQATAAAQGRTSKSDTANIKTNKSTKSKKLRTNTIVIQYSKNGMNKPYTCSYCQKIFDRLQYLKRHIRVHTGEKPYKCNICNRSFYCHSNLSSHVRTHGDRPFACDVCKKRFTRSSDLVTHRRIHTGEKPYKCNECMKGFPSKCSLLRHVRKHVHVETGERPFTCDFCKKSFSCKSCLVSHITYTHWGKTQQVSSMQKKFQSQE